MADTETIFYRTWKRTSPMDLQTPKKLHIEDLLEHYSKQMSVAHNRQYHFGPNGRRVKNEYDMCKLIGVKSLNFPKQLSESSTLQAEKFYNERGWYWARWLAISVERQGLLAMVL